MLLTKTVGVATIPYCTFYSNGEDHKLLRFCFAKKEESLIEAANRLQQVQIKNC
jgi:methionine aminotransferase